MDMSPPTKGVLVENHRWKTNGFSTNGKENLPLGSLNKSNVNTNEVCRDSGSSGRWECARRHPGSSGSASRMMTDTASPIRVHTLKLIGGVESFECAKDLHEACLTSDSMLQYTLDKIGFHGSVDDENSNINSTSSYKVLVKNSCIDASDKNEYSIVLEFTREMSQRKKSKLLEVFDDRKINATGFLEWLGGAKGWRFDCAKKKSVSWKRRFVIQLNMLQSVFTLFADPNQKFFFVDEPRMVWRKHNELTEIVSDIRVWIETIRPSDLTRRLLRNSSSGPDSPVHWAHHHPVTDYPLTVVSETTMIEVVEVSRMYIVSVPNDCLCDPQPCLLLFPGSS